MLDYFEKEVCLKIARKVLDNYTETKKMPTLFLENFREELKETDLMLPTGCFVTLKTGEGALRGCIGTIYSETPLFDNIVENTISASSKDPRFEALEKDELYEITLEISVMSPIEEIQDLSSIKIGTHGLIIVKGNNQGLLLPQVPVEWNWDLETFLKQTCLKAGLKEADYKDKDAKLYSFTAQVFSEGDVNEKAP